jgi:hypothetical protein
LGGRRDFFPTARPAVHWRRVKIFLLWRAKDGQATTPVLADVAARLQALFGPLFDQPLAVRSLPLPAGGLVSLERPVSGWKAVTCAEDAQTWALAVDYPVNSSPVLSARGVRFDPAQPLPALCRELQKDPESWLRDLAPPFSLLWADKSTGTFHVQNDGLGQAQLFECENDRLRALTNKLPALTALGFDLEIHWDEWAVRLGLGFFPLSMTGFKGVRFLAPSTRLRLESGGVTKQRCDVLPHWVRPPALPKDDALELARVSVLNHLKATLPLCARPSIGLSGGWDSRAIVAVLRSTGADFTARVRGLPTRLDVLLSQELARVAGLRLRVKHTTGLPAEDPADCARCIRQALLWQAGHMVTQKHKTFMVQGRPFDGGAVNLSGQHGELGRAFHLKRIRAEKLPEDRLEDSLVTTLLTNAAALMTPRARELVREAAREGWRQADRFGLPDSARLDFFFLHEETRRWGSGAVSALPGVVITPFLNPGFIRAVFSWHEHATESNPFHRHIIATHAPEWLPIPCSEELEARLAALQPAAAAGAATASADPAAWRQPEGRYNYSSRLYWQAVGRPLLEAALARGGPWMELFDPTLLRARWPEAADELAIAAVLAVMKWN